MPPTTAPSDALPLHANRRQVAGYLNISEDGVRRLDPVLKPARVGQRRLVYDRDAVLAYMADAKKK